MAANPEGQESDSEELFPQIQMQQMDAMQGVVTHGGPAPPQPVPIPNRNVQNTNSSPPSTNAVSHNHVQSGSVSPTTSALYGVMTETKQPSAKLYCIVTWRILTHALLLYAVAGVTYLLFVDPNSTNNDCACTTASALEDLNVSDSPTTNPVELPTESPSNIPSQSPVMPNIVTTGSSTEIPTKIPTQLPTTTPSNIPSVSPTSSPTEYYEHYNHYVGDYKVSAQVSDHGNWLLCDGSIIDSRDYPLLYAEIGDTFGTDGGFGFRLPDVTDKVVGISGSSHSIGDEIGSETASLTTDNLPSHFFYVSYSGECTGAYSTGLSREYLADFCGISNNFYNGGGENYRYTLAATTATPNRYKTNSIGNGDVFDVMNPTVYAGNLFIFAM